jgi:dynein heavy chain, axonemal
MIEEGSKAGFWVVL